jgi:hypothetical protein
MRYFINFILIPLIFSACSISKEREISPMLSVSKSSLFSDKYRLIWNNDPTSTMTIAWNQYNGEGEVRYGLVSTRENKTAPNRVVEYRGMKNCFVRLTGLHPNNRYYFKVCTEEHCSDTMYFKTAPHNNQSFTFVAGGDSRSIPRGRIRGNILISKIRPLFIAHGGDYTSHGNSKEWSKWLEEWQLTKSRDGRMYPLIVTHGNHENEDREMLSNLFDVPNKDVYYKINFPLLSLYTLNTELEPSVGYYDFKTDDPSRWNAQKAWLEKELSNDRKRWKIISYHRPLRPHRASKHEGKLRYSDWASLFYNHRVQLAIESDSHLVKYTKPLKPNPLGDEGFSVDEEYGTTYIGEGSWGAPTRTNDDDKPWTIDSGSFWQFKLITVDSKSLEIRTVKFGDEKTDYNPNGVEGITQKQQNRTPKIIPKNLDLWDSKVGTVLKL